MSDEPFYYDQYFEESFPSWRDVSPEEHMAHHWLGFGAFSMRNNEFKDKDMEKWARRFEEIFHSENEIEECRMRFLTESERRQQDRELKKIMKHGL